MVFKGGDSFDREKKEKSLTGVRKEKNAQKWGKCGVGIDFLCFLCYNGGMAIGLPANLNYLKVKIGINICGGENQKAM